MHKTFLGEYSVFLYKNYDSSAKKVLNNYSFSTLEYVATEPWK